MNEKDIREYSRTLLDAFNDLTGNSINPNLDDFLKIRERSIFELNSFHKNNQKKNETVDVPSNQKTNVDENKIVNEIDDLKEKKELSLTPTLKLTSKVKKQENVKSEDKPTLIQNKKQNVENKQKKNDNKINQESKNVVKNETSNSNVIADKIEETDDFVFGNDEDNFNMSERKTAFDILKGIEDPWN